MKTKWFNFFERVLWTLLQVTSAEVLLGFWEAVNGSIGENRNLYLVVLTGLLAAVKNAVTQTFINPSGATLPTNVAPVVSEEVAVKVNAETGEDVAWTGSSIPNNEPVIVEKAA